MILKVFTIQFFLLAILTSEFSLQAQTNSQLEATVISKLKTIEDPELNLNIYDLGLVRKIEISDGNKVKIRIIFTKLFCPYGKQMVNEIKKKVGAIPSVKECTVVVDINTRWKRSMLTEEGKEKLKDTYTW